MNDARKTGRRTSDRLREKEDQPILNGKGNGNTKGSEKGASSDKQRVNGSDATAASKKTKEKRKLGTSRWRTMAARMEQERTA